MQNLTQNLNAIQSANHLEIRRFEIKFEGFIVLVSVLGRPVGDDFDAEDNELLTDHDGPWVGEFVAKSDGLYQEPG